MICTIYTIITHIPQTLIIRSAITAAELTHNIKDKRTIISIHDVLMPPALERNTPADWDNMPASQTQNQPPCEHSVYVSLLFFKPIYGILPQTIFGKDL